MVPEGSNAAKLAGIKAFGATLYLCGPTLADRDEMSARIAHETGATMIHPFTNPQVIAGQGTAARELLAEFPDLDTIVTPIGGGGLIGGTSIAARAIKPGIRLFGAEPEGASDAFQSLRAGERRVDIAAEHDFRRTARDHRRDQFRSAARIRRRGAHRHATPKRRPRCG